MKQNDEPIPSFERERLKRTEMRLAKILMATFAMQHASVSEDGNYEDPGDENDEGMACALAEAKAESDRNVELAWARHAKNVLAWIEEVPR